MARKRMISPNIWQDPDFGQLSSDAQIMVIGLISNADDEGRLRGNPAYLKSIIFVYKNLAFSKIQKIRDEIMCKMKNFVLYSVNGEEYIQLKNWDKYQTQREDRIIPSQYPAPKDGQVADTCQTLGSQVTAEVKLSKEKLSKENAATPEVVAENGKDIAEVIDAFQVVNPAYKKLFGNKTQRAAVERLLASSDKKKLIEIVNFLPKSNAARYGPTITTPLQLEDKMGALIAFSQKLKDSGKHRIVV